jgi:hypothetical protein
MSGKPVLRIVFPMIFALVAVSVIRQKTALKESSFVRDANRPFVYPKFERIGAGVRRNEDEPSFCAWFHFVNNSSVPIRLRTYGEPEGSPADEVGVMDDVVVDQPLITITANSSGPQVEHEPTSGKVNPTAEANVERSALSEAMLDA